MRFKGFDLNLLVALDALLTERSVTAAAERMRLSQPAMSAALNRLREYLGDDVLVSYGKRMVPTAYAEQLHGSVKDLLVQIEGVVSLSIAFDPASSERQFRISASDYIVEVLVAPVIRILAARAPGVGILITAPAAVSSVAFQRGEIDLSITPRQFLLEDHPARLLFAEKHVLVGWRDNPVMSKPITQEIFFSCGHVVAELGHGREPAYSERQMARFRRERRIEVAAPAFTLVGPLLVGTHRLALMHERLAIAQARTWPLTIAPNPFDFPDLEEMLQYHQARERDAGLTWLRNLIAETAENSLRDLHK